MILFVADLYGGGGRNYQLRRSVFCSRKLCFNMFCFYDDNGILTESENLRDLIAGILLVRDGGR